ncbi:hypothetical protein NKI48_34980, partial [Mesorhizobium sp. M0644]|uniref:hypothetical protein n=1 Tax=Mesorhizobium sp. M0644 TaxID=2956979 RepID=UPI00333C2B3F
LLGSLLQCQYVSLITSSRARWGQLGAYDVACVNPRDRVVHQKMDVQLRNACSLGDCPESLPQVIPPFRQIAAFLLVLDDVTAFALCWE